MIPRKQTIKCQGVTCHLQNVKGFKRTDTKRQLKVIKSVAFLVIKRALFFTKNKNSFFFQPREKTRVSTYLII